MIKYQSKILIFEASGVICPDNSICMYPINQVVFMPLKWGPGKSSYAPPTEPPPYSGEGLAWPNPTGKQEEAQVFPLVGDLFRTVGGPPFT